VSDIPDEPALRPPCSECLECGGRGGRWDEEAIDQWYWCRHCDAAEEEAMKQVPPGQQKGATMDVLLEEYAEQLTRKLDIHRKVRGPAKVAWRRADRRTALGALVGKSSPQGIHLKDAARMLGLTLRHTHSLMCDLVEISAVDVEVEPQSEGDAYVLRTSRMDKNA